MCLFLCHLLTHRQICNCQILPFWFWSSGTPKALCCGSKWCLQQWIPRAALLFRTVSPCWLCGQCDNAPDLTFLLQTMAPDYQRAWKRGVLAVLEVKFHHGNEPAWGADGTGFNGRFCDEHSKLNFMWIKTTGRWEVQKKLKFRFM